MNNYFNKPEIKRILKKCFANNRIVLNLRSRLTLCVSDIMRKQLSGRASPCQGEGRGSESRLSLCKQKKVCYLIAYFLRWSSDLGRACLPRQGVLPKRRDRLSLNPDSYRDNENTNSIFMIEMLEWWNWQTRWT